MMMLLLPLLPAPLAPAALSPGPAPASPAAAGGGPAPSASLLEQKLELEISLLKKQHRLLEAQVRLLQLQEEYYSQKLNMLKHRQSLE
ncbi:hypothetical protein DPX16_3765 [Anabarilius grahami]|uniref:Uncharacterized protein n=1 Tax=Anabarilius grahami TaxID=495550 RepID=A0A3N0XZW5_ANAGA|nr:hypothetical protein DPX16_3765 [Anabarilius grahami]